MMRKALAGAGAVACAMGVALAVPATAAADPATGAAADSRSYQATLNPINANKVTGEGVSWITVTGTTADVRIQVNGLLDGVPHAQHIRVDGQGTCPTQAQQHNGLPSITVTDAAPQFGTIGTSLTVDGDSTPAHGLDMARFPTTGSYTYARTIELDPNVVANLQEGTAVLVVSGIDYDGNGRYDGLLGVSELDPRWPAEATDPALCGTFEPMQMAAVPVGAADTGGGSSSSTSSPSAGIAVGAAGLLIVSGAMAVARRRTARD